jgi:hypothetical protein
MAFSTKTQRGGEPFVFVQRWLGRYSPLRGYTELTASVKAKIPSRSTLCNFQTGSELKKIARFIGTIADS